MYKEVPEANPPLSSEEQSIVAKLTHADIQVIDSAILANSSTQWNKVAWVVVMTEKSLSDLYPGLSYIFYSQRLIRLSEEGRLESQGNLQHIRFSEVRLPTQ